MTDTDQPPVYGCTIDGQPAMPILISEHTELVARAERAEAELRRYTEAESADAAAGSYAHRAEQAEAELAKARQRAADAYGQRDRLRLRIAALADRWRLPGHISMPDAAAEIAEALDREKWAPTPDPITRVRALADRWKRNGTRDLARYADIMLAEMSAPQPTIPADEQYRFATTWAEYNAGRRAAADRKAATPAAVEARDPCPHCDQPYPRRLMETHLAVEHPDVLGRLAESGVHTPGCDCGHDGMGVSWHSDDCPWRRSILDGSKTSTKGDSKGAPPVPAEEPGTVTDPAWLGEQYAKALDEAFSTFNPDETEDAYLTTHIVNTVMRARDRHVDQLRQRLALADQVRRDDLAELRRLQFVFEENVRRHNATRDRVDELLADLDRERQRAEVDQRCDRYAATLRKVLDALDRNGGVPPTETDVDRWRAVLGNQPDEHIYLSTGCRHGDHDYCKNMTGMNGAKRPASCKFCQAPCRCFCHKAT